jgi:hypothetical protein
VNLIDIFNAVMYAWLVYAASVGHPDYAYVYNRVVLEVERVAKFGTSH